MKYQVGQRVSGVINNITDLGIFVTLPKRVSSLIHHDDFGSDWLHERRRYQVGQEIRVVVVHNYKGRIALSKRRVNDPDLLDPTNKFSTSKKENFLPVLTKTANDARDEIKHLRQELNAYAN